VQWIDESDRNKGLRFDGRVARGLQAVERDLRQRRSAARAHRRARRAVRAGCGDHGTEPQRRRRADLPHAARARAGRLPPDAPLGQALASEPVLERFRQLLDALAAQATGSATRLARLLLLAEAPSIDSGEITDKGSINQRAVLRRRDALVQALHDETAPGILKPGRRS